MRRFSLFNSFSKPPGWTGPLPEVYAVPLSLDRLRPGVDNFNYDVHLSPDFRKTIRKIIQRYVIRQAKAELFVPIDSTANPVKDRHEFTRLCRELLLEGVNRAKLRNNEIQIDFLAQTALVKLLTRGIRNQFSGLVNHFSNVIWEYEVARNQDLGEIVRLREKLIEVRQAKETIITEVSRQLFTSLADLQQQDLNRIRQVNFGKGAVLSRDLFFNPLFFVDKPTNDLFMVREYVLLGHRYEDPNQYDSLLILIKSLLHKVFRQGAVEESAGPTTGSATENGGASSSVVEERLIDGLLRNHRTVDLLFDVFQTRDLFRKTKRDRENGPLRRQLKKKMREQQKLLDFFYHHFKATGMMKRIVGSFLMQPLCKQYCPPLVPQQLLQFIILPAARNRIVSQLRWVERLYGRSLPLAPLRQATRRLGAARTPARKEFLVRFFKQFFRYHRDYENYTLIKGFIDRVNLATTPEIINLSRANNTLYEFLLPHEKVLSLDEKPISGHVILKADVRGATIITSQLQQRGLNPASYFSLNFFNPISELLAEYNATKVFIEGDAIILSISEHEDTPTEWYGAARACGLAVNMLQLIKQYNTRNRKYRLPVMELGIGISFQQGPPSFLFDGDRQIMISPAINLADRLSSCDKAIRRRLESGKMHFNLFVFQVEDARPGDTGGGRRFLRYNVNGIELQADGFEKLRNEIRLKQIDISPLADQHEIEALYTGKFPTLPGRYQRLVIREATALLLDPADVGGKEIGKSSCKYYEICTQPWVYELAKMAD